MEYWNMIIILCRLHDFVESSTKKNEWIDMILSVMNLMIDEVDSYSGSVQESNEIR